MSKQIPKEVLQAAERLRGVVWMFLNDEDLQRDFDFICNYRSRKKKFVRRINSFHRKPHHPTGVVASHSLAFDRSRPQVLTVSSKTQLVRKVFYDSVYLHLDQERIDWLINGIV